MTLSAEPPSYRATRVVLRMVFRLLCRPRISGVENVPPVGPVLLASNHLSFIDSVVIPLTVPRRVTFLAKAEYFDGHGVRGRAVAMFFQGIGAVPVRRGGGRDEAADALQAAQSVLSDGGAFGVYPEGTRSRDGRLYRGRTGVAWLALATGAKIVPVAITGTDRVQPPGSRVLRPHRVTVTLAPPIDPEPWIKRVETEGRAGQARREITDLVMDAIAEMSGQVRAEGYNQPPAGSGESTAI